MIEYEEKGGRKIDKRGFNFRRKEWSKERDDD